MRWSIGARLAPRSLVEARAILGLGRQATVAEVKAAYRRAALRTHPDQVSAARRGGALLIGSLADADGEAFRRVSEAYTQVLRAAEPSRRGERSADHVDMEDEGEGVRPEWWPRHSSVGFEAADRLFRRAFGGRGVEEVMRAEMAREGIQSGSARHGVHARLLQEALYARLLRQARENSRGPETARVPQVEVKREKWSDSWGGEFVRVLTLRRRPDGSFEETVVDKPVYRM